MYYTLQDLVKINLSVPEVKRLTKWIPIPISVLCFQPSVARTSREDRVEEPTRCIFLLHDLHLHVFAAALFAERCLICVRSLTTVLTNRNLGKAH